MSNKEIYYYYHTGFSLSFKVDSYNVTVGGLAIEYCRQFQAFIPYFTPFSQKLQGSNLKVAIFEPVAGT